MKQCKIAIIVLIIFCLLVCTVQASQAENACTVYADEIRDINKNDTFDIPIKIKDCSGIMGFKIGFETLNNSLKIVGIDSGDLTKNGMLNHNADINDKSFEVIWTGTEEFKGDGVLFVLHAKCESNFNSVIFDVNYSKEDTFNEKYDDVSIICQKIVLNGKLQNSDDKQNNTECNEAIKSWSNEDIKNTEILEKTVDQILSDASADVLYKKISAVLKEFDASRPSEIKKDRVNDFITRISDSIENFKDKLKEISDNDAILIIDRLYSESEAAFQNKEELSSSISNNVNDNENQFGVFCFVVIISAAGLLIFVLIIRRFAFNCKKKT